MAPKTEILSWPLPVAMPKCHRWGLINSGKSRLTLQEAGRSETRVRFRWGLAPWFSQDLLTVSSDALRCPHLRRKGAGRAWDDFYKAPIPLWRAPPSWLKHLPSAPPHTPSRRASGFPHSQVGRKSAEGPRHLHVAVFLLSLRSRSRAHGTGSIAVIMGSIPFPASLCTWLRQPASTWSHGHPALHLTHLRYLPRLQEGAAGQPSLPRRVTISRIRAPMQPLQGDAVAERT